jgi:hypothetical protein
MKLVRSETIGGRTEVSENKAYDISNSCSSSSSSQVPPQFNAEFLVLKGAPPTSSVFFPLVPVS